MMRRFMLVAAVAILLLGLSTGAHAKYRGFAQEMFFGRHTGAAGAATGRTGVTSSGEIIDTFYNPAGLADAKGVGFCLSWSDPYYLLEDAKYRFWGANVQVGDYGTVGVSRYKLDYGPIRVSPGIGGETRYGSSDAAILVVTLAGEPVKDLLVGVNISAFQYNFEVGGGRSMDGDAYWADVGLLKYLTLGRTQSMNSTPSTSSMAMYQAPSSTPSS